MIVVFGTNIAITTDDGKVDYSTLLCNRKSLHRVSVDEKSRFIKTKISDKSNRWLELVTIGAVSSSV